MSVLRAVCIARRKSGRDHCSHEGSSPSVPRWRRRRQAPCHGGRKRRRRRTAARAAIPQPHCQLSSHSLCPGSHSPSTPPPQSTDALSFMSLCQPLQAQSTHDDAGGAHGGRRRQFSRTQGRRAGKEACRRRSSPTTALSATQDDGQRRWQRCRLVPTTTTRRTQSLRTSTTACSIHATRCDDGRGEGLRRWLSGACNTAQGRRHQSDRRSSTGTHVHYLTTSLTTSWLAVFTAICTQPALPAHCASPACAAVLLWQSHRRQAASPRRVVGCTCGRAEPKQAATRWTRCRRLPQPMSLDEEKGVSDSGLSVFYQLDVLPACRLRAVRPHAHGHRSAVDVLQGARHQGTPAKARARHAPPGTPATHKRRTCCLHAALLPPSCCPHALPARSPHRRPALTPR